jgi:hypothetical protein
MGSPRERRDRCAPQRGGRPDRSRRPSATACPTRGQEGCRRQLRDAEADPRKGSPLTARLTATAGFVSQSLCQVLWAFGFAGLGSFWSCCRYGRSPVSPPYVGTVRAASTGRGFQVWSIPKTCPQEPLSLSRKTEFSESRGFKPVSPRTVANRLRGHPPFKGGARRAQRGQQKPPLCRLLKPSPGLGPGTASLPWRLRPPLCNLVCGFVERFPCKLVSKLHPSLEGGLESLRLPPNLSPEPSPKPARICGRR